jgi:hypothetical protein
VKRLRGYEIAIGALVATAIWALIFVLTSDAASHYEICEAGKEGTKQAAKDCASYDVVSFAFREIRMHLDIVSALITAVATAFIARYTFTLKRSTDNLWTSAKEQLDLAREEFISTHRPKIIIHAIDVKRFPNGTNPEVADKVDGLGAILLCVNKGRSRAVNVEIRATTMASKSIPDAKIQRPIVKTVDCLESGIKIWTEVDTGRSIQEIVAFKQPIFFVGTIGYFDGNETRRETGFCYVFDLNSGSWKRTESEAHNYAY